MFLLPLILGCLQGPAQMRTSVELGEQTDTVEMTVLARVVAPGSAAAWEAVARGLGAPAPRLLPGECVTRGDKDAAPIPAVVHSLGVQGALAGALLPGPSSWRTASGLRTVDPAWTVADVTWSRGDALGKRTLSRAVRFGPSPRVREIELSEDGLHLRWDPPSVEHGEVAFTSSGGEVLCGAGTAGIVVPARFDILDGEVRLRSVHMHSEQASPKLRIQVRAVIERAIRLDVPPAETAPSALPPAPTLNSPTPRKGRVRPTRG